MEFLFYFKVNGSRSINAWWLFILRTTGLPWVTVVFLAYRSSSSLRSPRPLLRPTNFPSVPRRDGSRKSKCPGYCSGLRFLIIDSAILTSICPYMPILIFFKTETHGSFEEKYYLHTILTVDLPIWIQGPTSRVLWSFARNLGMTVWSGLVAGASQLSPPSLKLIRVTFLLEKFESLSHILSWGVLAGRIATTKSSRSTMLFTRKMMKNWARMKKHFINGILRHPTDNSELLAIDISSFTPLPQTSGGRWECQVQTSRPSLCSWCKWVGRWFRGRRKGHPG